MKKTGKFSIFSLLLAFALATQALAYSDEGMLDHRSETLQRAQAALNNRNANEALRLSNLLLLSGTVGVTFEFNNHMNKDQRKQSEEAFWESAKVWNELLATIGTGGELAPRFVPAQEGTNTTGTMLVSFIRDLSHEGKPVAGLMYSGTWDMKMRVETHGQRNLFGGTVRNWKKEFRAIILHELGHAFGLDHFGAQKGNLMAAVLTSTDTRGPSETELSVLKEFRDNAARLRESALDQAHQANR